MPAVVRGGRRQAGAPSRAAPRQGGPKGGAPRANTPRGRGPAAVPAGRASALGKLDLSPRAVVLTACAGVLLLGGVLFTGARAERIGVAVDHKVDTTLAGMGLSLRTVHLQGASPEATPAIRAAVPLRRGQPMTGLDLDAIKASVESVGWVKEARVVRLLPDTLIVSVVEHDRLAVWQTAGHAYVVDAQGAVIPGADPGRHPELPLIVGQGADEAAADILPLVAQRPRLARRIEALVRVDQRRWDLRLKDGAVVQLPALDQEAALIQLDALDQREHLLDLGFARVDLRSPDAVVVRPSGATPV